MSAGLAAYLASTAATSEKLLAASSTLTSYDTALPEADSSGSLSLVAYVMDRYLGAGRATAIANVTSLASAFLTARRRLVSRGGDSSSMGSLSSVSRVRNGIQRRMLTDASDDFGSYLSNFSSSV